MSSGLNLTNQTDVMAIAPRRDSIRPGTGRMGFGFGSLSRVGHGTRFIRGRGGRPATPNGASLGARTAGRRRWRRHDHGRPAVRERGMAATVYAKRLEFMFTNDAYSSNQSAGVRGVSLALPGTAGGWPRARPESRRTKPLYPATTAAGVPRWFDAMSLRGPRRHLEHDRPGCAGASEIRLSGRGEAPLRIHRRMPAVPRSSTSATGSEAATSAPAR
jgi:hypothetical protein